MLKLADRVKETTTTTGTGAVSLAGAAAGYRSFVSGIGNGHTCYYCIAGGSEWEVGIGTVTDAATDTLSREKVLASSNAGALVNFSAGTKDVFVTSPASILEVDPGVCQGRLTLESGVPVSTTDQTAKTTVYFTPFNGNRIALYNGNSWVLHQFSELSLALGTLTSGKNYDVFVYDNGGTPALELSAAWTTDTVRATALVLQDGVYVKSGATTRRFLGTIRTTSTTTTEDSTAKRFVGNAYHRSARKLLKAFASGTQDHTYIGLTNTWRAFNNDTANRVEAVIPLPDVRLHLRADTMIYSSGWGAVSLDEDGTSASDADIFIRAWNAEAPTYGIMERSPAVGYHYYQMVEMAANGVSVGFGGSAPNSGYQAGIIGEVWM